LKRPIFDVSTVWIGALSLRLQVKNLRYGSDTADYKLLQICVTFQGSSSFDILASLRDSRSRSQQLTCKAYGLYRN
jgi:hypothetical protein